MPCRSHVLRHCSNSLLCLRLHFVVMDFSVSVKQTDSTAKWSPDGLLIAAVVDRRIVVRDAQSLSVVRVRRPCAWRSAAPPPSRTSPSRNAPEHRRRLPAEDVKYREPRSSSRAWTRRHTWRGARTPATCSACCSTGPWSRSSRCWTPHGRRRSTKASLVRCCGGFDRPPSQSQPHGVSAMSAKVCKSWARHQAA